MKNTSFEIHVSVYSSSAREWQRAQQADASALPSLSAEQKETARKFGITEEEYARSVLAGTYGREAMKQRAQALGEAVQKVLDSQNQGGRVIALYRDIDRVGWIVRIETPKKDVDAFISQELTDDLLDNGSADETRRLKARIESSLSKTASLGRK